MLTKTKLQEHIDSMPNEFTIEELVERLVFIEKVEAGLTDSENGEKISEEELETQIKKWLS